MPYRNGGVPQVGDEVSGIGEHRLDEEQRYRMTTGVVSFVSALTGKIAVSYLEWDGVRIVRRLEHGDPIHFDKL